MFTVADLIATMKDDADSKLSAFGRVFLMDGNASITGEITGAWVDRDGDLRIQFEHGKPSDKA